MEKIAYILEIFEQNFENVAHRYVYLFQYLPSAEFYPLSIALGLVKREFLDKKIIKFIDVHVQLISFG